MLHKFGTLDDVSALQALPPLSFLAFELLDDFSQRPSLALGHRGSEDYLSVRVGLEHGQIPTTLSRMDRYGGENAGTHHDSGAVHVAESYV